MNDYISKYLDLYIERKSTDYAILLNGKWGCGKTFFIKEYQQQKENEEYKFLYVSLFGLNSISEINDAIFKELHPILGHKATRYMGGVIASMIKFGLKVDLFGSDNQETSINIDLSKINPLEDKNYKKLVFIFDDLERSKINIPEVLGFINFLCEQSESKVILIANEEEIDNIYKDDYNKFKEKVIGKSFDIKNNERSYWIQFKNKNKDNILVKDDHISSITWAYNKYGENNFRNLNRVTEEFIDFYKEIDEKYLNNSEFSNLLVKYFFALSLHFRKSNNIQDTIGLLQKDKDLSTYQILQRKTWNDVLTSYSIKKDDINHEISSLIFFQDDSKTSWVNLWHYRTLNENDFNKNLDDVLSKFNSFDYKDPYILIHVFSLLAYFYKHDLSTVDIRSIQEKIEQYIDKYVEHDSWSKYDILSPFSNRTGYGYIGEDEPEIVKIRNEFREKLNKKRESLIIDMRRKKVIDFLSIVNTQSHGEIHSALEPYRHEAILGIIDREIIDKHLNRNNISILNLLRVLDYRYTDSGSINGSSYAHYFFEEKPFLELLLDFLESMNNEEALPKFDKFNLGHNIEFLKEILTRFE